MRVVGMCGKARSGKNYLAEQVLVPDDYLPLALAGPMKSELAAEEVIPAEEAIGQVDKSPRTRRILQLWGTELGRERYYEDYWCVRMEWWISHFLNAGFERFVITDIRFPNEVDWVKSMGGIVVRVTGRGGLSGEAAEHASETALDSVDLPEVDNSPENAGRVADQLRETIEQHYRDNPEPGV